MQDTHNCVVCYSSCVQPYPFVLECTACIQKSCDCTCHIQLHVHNVLELVLCTWLAMQWCIKALYLPTSIGGCEKIERWLFTVNILYQRSFGITSQSAPISIIIFMTILIIANHSSMMQLIRHCTALHCTNWRAQFPYIQLYNYRCSSFKSEHMIISAISCCY